MGCLMVVTFRWCLLWRVMSTESSASPAGDTPEQPFFEQLQVSNHSLRPASTRSPGGPTPEHRSQRFAAGCSTSPGSASVPPSWARPRQHTLTIADILRVLHSEPEVAVLFLTSTTLASALLPTR